MFAYSLTKRSLKGSYSVLKGAHCLSPPLVPPGVPLFFPFPFPFSFPFPFFSYYFQFPLVPQANIPYQCSFQFSAVSPTKYPFEITIVNYPFKLPF